MNRNEVRASHFLDEFRLAEPLCVGADFMLGHGCKRIHLIGKAADKRDFGNEVNEHQEWCKPGFHKHDAAAFSQDALHFRKSLIQVSRQIRQVMQAALHNEHILAAVCERKFAAIGNDAIGALVLRNQSGRKVHPFQARESKALQCN